jgi:hypothetical protein
LQAKASFDVAAWRLTVAGESLEVPAGRSWELVLDDRPATGEIVLEAEAADVFSADPIALRLVVRDAGGASERTVWGSGQLVLSVPFGPGVVPP